MRTFFTFLLMILLITGFGGCYRCSIQPYVDMNDMSVSAIRLTPSFEFNQLTQLLEKDSVSFDSLIIYTSFSGSLYGLKSEQDSYTFLPTAFASEDCDDGLGGSKETYQSINVITLTDFDNEYVAGDTINNIINVTANQTQQPKSLTQFIAEIQPGIPTGYQGAKLLFFLNRKPTKKVLQFRVAVSFTNGEKYSGETIPITIKQ